MCDLARLQFFTESFLFFSSPQTPLHLSFPVRNSSESRTLCGFVVSGAESFSCQLREKRVSAQKISQSSPWLGSANTSNNAVVPFQVVTQLYVSCRPAAEEDVVEGGEKTHSVWMRSLSNRSAALSSDMHLSADKLRIPSLSSASPLLCLSAPG